MTTVKLIVTIKNRAEHFIQSIPFLLSQYGIDYELIIVDYHSNDGFNEILISETELRKPTFSPFLKKIHVIRLTEDLKFNLTKARNLGPAFFSEGGQVYCFTDIDTFLSMNYLKFWSDKVVKNKTFTTSRKQESRASLPSRLRAEVNGGNCCVYSDDFFEIRGYDESMLSWGGDDDDLYHRLKLVVLREINPYNANDALQYSILQGEELRLKYLEVPERAPKQETFDKIYLNQSIENNNSDFLKPEYASSIATMQELYRK